MNMKNFRHFLWFIALVGLITSCSQDEAAGPQNEASNRVRIGAGIDAMTRAASVTIPANHKLRYVLEVWSTEAEPACVYRDEKATTEATAEAFDFVLTEAGNYKALLWADFVPGSETGTPVTPPNAYTHYADHYYVTNSADGLKAVALAKTGEDYVINDDARDAFFSCLPIKKETGAFAKSVELKRPFGQINVIEKNTALLAKVGTMTLTYTVPDGFSVETGATTGTANVTPTVSTLPTATDVRKANLFYDFIFAPATGQFTMTGIAMKFTSKDAHVTLPDYTIPANMPVVRNKRTNISGSILTANSNDVTLTVTVSDGWTTGDEEQNIDKVSVWDGTYPTSVEQAKEWLGTETTGGTDEDAINHVFTITDARQLAAMHYLWVNKTKLEGAKIPDPHPNGEAGMVDATYVDASYNLATDINLNEKTWTPMGGQEVYNGIFNGQGHTVYGMNCNGSTYRTGFIATCRGTIKNLNVKGNIDVNGSGVDHGGVVGYLGGTIAFCSFQGSIKASCNNTYNTCSAGGVAGFISLKGNVTSSYSVLTHIEATGGLDTPAKGGITGYLLGAIKGCYWQKLDGLNNAYGKKDDYRDPVVENCDQFADAAAANAAVGAMNGYAGDNDYQWQAGTDGSYPVLVKK